MLPLYLFWEIFLTTSGMVDVMRRIEFYDPWSFFRRIISSPPLRNR